MCAVFFAKDNEISYYFDEQHQLEEKYGEKSVVLMQFGSFYEIYGINVENVSIGKASEMARILNMKMALKSNKKEHASDNPWLVGFPDYAIDEHLGTLLRNYYTVAIYDQTGKMVTKTDSKTGKKQKVKERKLVEIFTPSTFIDDTTHNENNLMAIEFGTYKSGSGIKSTTALMLKKAHVAILSASTGKVTLMEFYDRPDSIGKVDSEVYRVIHSYNPKEIIVSGISSTASISSAAKVYNKSIPSDYYKTHYQDEFLARIYKKPSKSEFISHIDYLELERNTSLIPVLIMVLEFVYTQNKLIINRLEKPKVIQSSNYMMLNNDSVYQLNIIGESESSDRLNLFDMLCCAKTPMGKRHTKSRILAPIVDTDKLNRHYDFIDIMIPMFTKFGELLSGICDIEKRYRKMVIARIQPYEFAELGESMARVGPLLRESASFGVKSRVVDAFGTFYEDLTSTWNFTNMRCKMHEIGDSFLVGGLNPKIDGLVAEFGALRTILTDIATKISATMESGKKDAKSHLRVAKTDKGGWYLTCSKSKFQQISADIRIEFEFGGTTHKLSPSDFKLKKLENSVKISSTIIDKISDKMVKNRASLKELMGADFKERIADCVTRFGRVISRVAATIGRIDYIYSCARNAAENGYTRPKIGEARSTKMDTDGSYINAVGLRHPIIESIIDGEYIPNDICLGAGDAELHTGSLIYGLNMAGKSSLLKATGCAIVMAQAGMYVAASELDFHPFRNLLSKMTIRDDMSKGQSTFMVEILEIRDMLAKSDEYTLVLSDELCSSTESTSAHAIVGQTLQTLTEKGALFLFSTHLHELQKMDIVTKNEAIRLFHFKMNVGSDGSINYVRKLAEGGLSELYGLEVARAMGLPSEFMKGAFKIRDTLTHSNSQIMPTKKSRYNSRKYVSECEECGSTQNLHTHHKLHQQDANEHGLINGRIHKNKKFNLRILCAKCHDAEHADDSDSDSG